MPPRNNPRNPRNPRNGQGRTKGYERSDGTKVRGYSTDRGNGMPGAGKAWAGAGMSALVSTGLVLELGFTIISGLAIVATTFIAAGALWAQAAGGEHQNKSRRRIASNNRRRPSTRRRPQRKSWR